MVILIMSIPPWVDNYGLYRHRSFQTHLHIYRHLKNPYCYTLKVIVLNKEIHIHILNTVVGEAIVGIWMHRLTLVHG